MKSKDITNKKFGRLTPIRFIRKVSYGYYWLFKCDCGENKIILKASVVNKRTESCGCLHKEMVRLRFKKHEMSSTRFYNIWVNMKQRCTNVNNTRNKKYDGRG